MKKWIIGALILICAVSGALAFTSCAYEEEKHNWSTKWRHNSRYHWHECLDEDCDMRSSLESHDFELEEYISDPTCDKDGTGKFACTVCGEVKEDVVPATGAHIWQERAKREPTCYAGGFIEKYCILCLKESSEELPATGKHVFDETQWVALGSTGHAHPCVNADEGCTEVTDFGTHNKSKLPVTVPAKEYEDGSTTYKCTVCSYDMEVSVIPATHIPVAMTISITKYPGYWADDDPEPVITESDGEYYVTLVYDEAKMTYPYRVTATGYFEDETSETLDVWQGVGKKYGVSGYMISKSTGLESSRLSSAGSIIWYTWFRCRAKGEFRVKFSFETGDVDRENVKQRVSVIFNITVVGYEEAFPTPSDTVTTVTPDEAYALFVDEGFRKRNGI